MIVLAGAIALAFSGAFSHGPAAPAGMQYAANNNTPAPAQGQQAPPIGRMQLQAQYMGPLRDTVIQRWRDPLDGTICYIYLPVIVQHGAGPNNLVQYGANSIGSISCLVGH
ncbi:MAG TPA: hypothetical protein VGG69_07255 [Rhizomicrobium sp.]